MRLISKLQQDSSRGGCSQQGQWKLMQQLMRKLLSKLMHSSGNRDNIRQHSVHQRGRGLARGCMGSRRMSQSLDRASGLTQQIRPPNRLLLLLSWWAFHLLLA